MFKITDIYGVIAVIFSLVFVYLILDNSSAGKQLLGETFSGSTGLIKVLQGRG